MTQNPGHVLRANLFGQGGQRQRFHCVVELRQIAGPVFIAQKIQRRGAEMALGRLPGFNQPRQYLPGEIGNIFAVFAQAGHRQRQAIDRLKQPGIERTLID